MLLYWHWAKWWHYIENYFAPAPVTSRGQPVRLSTDPKGERIVYACGRTIVMRSLSEPEKAWEYTGHTAATTVARFSPSGYYVASGDVTGKVRIWDSINDEHILKSEFQPLSSRVADIAWDMESKRIMAVGDGKNSFGQVFTFDTGNSVGTVMAHSRVINACTMRQRRPFRAVTCSDDMTCVFYHGAPYTYASSLSDHTGFVQDVRYAPSDEYFVTVGADRKIFLYEGTSGELVRQVAAGDAEAGHTGSILAVAWSPDSRYIVTSSSDRTCKFWDIGEDRLVGTVVIGDGSQAVEHQQVGNVWAGDYIVSLSLSGALNYLQLDSATPVRVVTGHQRPITAAALTRKQTLYTASYDGRLCTWDFGGRLPLGVATTATGSLGAARVEDAAASGELVALGSLDGRLRFAEASAVTSANTAVLSSATRSLDFDAAGTAVIAVLQDDAVVLVRNGQAVRVKLSEHDSAAPRIVAVSAASSLVAIGFEDCSVRLYKLSGEALAPTGARVAGHLREITALAFSADGALLASGDAGGKIIVAHPQSGEVVTARWGAHTARVYKIAWAPDAAHAASASLDGHVIVWSVDTPTSRIIVRNAHLGGVSTVHFLDNDTVVSTGADAGVKVWGFTYD
ncbi:WD40 repeat-like protein [Coemansia reversa NRRL 1564]|uniref:WD40 repeat-like protein n=1 Tax=Coemansia reversa (strain ATCC 12441 / NRRL 1564) TaxID=763665 RepID=A0A2G5BGI2_COERN|nr:WD40 repeat-like protein [Coemansia reversa NRRL 1564]|eukprot:PIA18136.1 WD40 repeat-like protein [Coemansia reversa NRRL 1564]